MLLAKISPAAEYIHKPTPFTHEIITLDYMMAAATPYRLGATEVEFTTRFGNLMYNTKSGKLAHFAQYQGGNVKLTQEEIADWGTDDKVVLTKIAEKYGVEIVEIIEADDSILEPPISLDSE